MRIDEIEIRNFRGFDERTFTFDPHMNVVVGNNTSGKTALLHAVQIALGGYLKYLDLLKVANQQYRRNFSRSDIRTVYNHEKQEFIPVSVNPLIEAKGYFTENIESLDGAPIQQETHIQWSRVLNYNTSDHGDMKSKAKELARIRRLEGEKGRAIMPLMLAFGSKRLVDNYQKVKKTKGVEVAVEKAYKNALLDSVDFDDAFDWIYHYGHNLKKGMATEGSNFAFIFALTTAIPALKSIYINGKDNRFEAQYTVTGLPTDYRTYETMSDGFKSTIGIVADMAYRCILLNGFLGEDAVIKTPGIVLIDEIDQFLHPRWQRHILQDLRNAFPNIQFIVTTHSPFIIQSVQNKNLIALDDVYKTIDPENMGIEEIAQRLMGMEGELRSEKYRRRKELATEYYRLVKEGVANANEIAAAKQRLDEIELDNDMKNDPVFAALMKSERSGI
mgnify:CR=1 FL=1